MRRHHVLLPEADLAPDRPPNPAEMACLAAIKGGAHSKTIIALRAGIDLRKVELVLRALVRRGLIEATGPRTLDVTPLGERLREAGVIDVAGAKARERRDPRAGTTAHKMLLLLDKPRRGADLAKSLGVTKQRVHQLVVKLSAQGLIRLGDPDHPMHVVARAGEPSVLLTIAQERLLSALPPQGMTRKRKLRIATGLEASGLETALAALGAFNLVAVTTGGDAEALYGLTPEGFNHWQREPDARHADLPSLPVRSDRIREVLTHFERHGPVRTVEAGRALNISRNSINALVQYLKRKRLIRKAEGEHHAPHELTPEGLAALVALRGSASNPK